MAGIVQLFDLACRRRCRREPLRPILEVLGTSWPGNDREHNHNLDVSDTPRLEHGTIGEH